MSSLYTIKYYPKAIDDLQSIYKYINENLLNPTAASNQFKTITDAVRSLEQMPERHQLVGWEPWNKKNIRQFPVNSYIVFYEVCSSTMLVNIVRIVYSGMNLNEIDANHSYTSLRLSDNKG